MYINPRDDLATYEVTLKDGSTKRYTNARAEITKGGRLVIHGPRGILRVYGPDTWQDVVPVEESDSRTEREFRE